MKTKTKKIVALVLAAVMLVCTTVAATVAYLTSQTEIVNNTFTVGKVEITLDEAKVDEYGKEIENAERVQGNKYKLIPGHKYKKDPTVHVAADSEESYIRMVVTISDIADAKEVLGLDETTGEFLPQNFVENWDSTVWLTQGVVENDNTATYEFWYKSTVSTVDSVALDLEPLFTEIFVPDTVNNDDLAKLEELQIDIIAHAIQADGFEKASDAWAAFDA